MKKNTPSGGRRLKSGARLEPLDSLRQQLMGNAEFRAEYDALRFREEIGQSLARARNAAGLTQAQVAKKAGTTQPVVARLEAGRGGVPSLPLLDRIAGAVGLRVNLRLESVKAA
jgi:DNA-binding XRE family transcriptional regulator